MEPRDVVVIGGSAGSLRPLLEMAGALPADLPGSVAVTIHVGEHAKSRLPWLLSRAGRLPAEHAEAGKQLQPGQIHVAPPGRHLLLPGGVIELSGGPRVNRHRPAVDAMFASAARWFGDRVVAVVLSGLLDDGAVGAALVALAGGLVVVQEPGDAEQPSMPRAALAAAPGAVAAPAKELGEMVSEMLGESGLASWPRAQLPDDTEVHMEDTSDLQFLSPEETRLTRLACPDCGGALAEAVLSRRAKLPVVLAQEGDRAKPGMIYIAPPNHHLLVEPKGVLVLSSSELVHFLRPSADLLFESVAGAYGPRAIACVLTGTGSDGAMGATAVKSRGGTVIAEDPATAEFKGMPEAVIAASAVDFILPLDEIATVIRGLVEANGS